MWTPDPAIIKTADQKTAEAEAQRRASFPKLSPRQFELMLLQIGLAAADIEAQILLLPEEDQPAALIEFRRANEYERYHWLVEPIANALGFTELEMDTMWRYAAAL